MRRRVSSSPMNGIMKEKSETLWLMDRDLLFMKLVISIRESSKIISHMDKVSTNIIKFNF